MPEYMYCSKNEPIKELLPLTLSSQSILIGFLLPSISSVNQGIGDGTMARLLHSTSHAIARPTTFVTTNIYL